MIFGIKTNINRLFYIVLCVLLFSQKQLAQENRHYAYEVDAKTLLPKNPTDKPNTCVTVVYPGNFATEVQATKYIEGAIKTSTNEIAICDKRLGLWSYVFAGSSLPEIRPVNNKPHYFWQMSQKCCLTVLQFAQMPQIVFDTITAKLVQRTYRRQGINVSKAARTAGDNDATSLDGHHINPQLFNLGQTRDIEQHAERVRQAEILYPHTPKILAGVSRGAFTTCVAVARNKYTNVPLVTLEGCGDSLPSLVEERFGWVPTETLRQKLYRSITKALTEHNPDGICPSKVAEYFPHTIPVAFISSRIDTEVPYANTKKIVEAFRKAGHPSTYFLTLDHSSHDGYMMDNEQDREKYHLFMKALYHTLNIQPELATFSSQTEYEKAMNILAESKVS